MRAKENQEEDKEKQAACLSKLVNEEVRFVQAFSMWLCQQGVRIQLGVQFDSWLQVFNMLQANVSQLIGMSRLLNLWCISFADHGDQCQVF